MADQVMGAPANSTVNDAPLCIQRYAGQATEDAETAPASVASVLASPGNPLEPTLRQDMGQRFGHDFSRVRVHTDAKADESARAVHAHAYTVGSDVVFAGGQYAPQTPAGQRLLAHELTHVIQQSVTDGETAVLRRYGHGNECDQKKYLEPYIWPGHNHAKNVTRRAIEELGKSPLHSTVQSELIRLFGPGADKRVGDIKSNFAKIESGLGEEYMYRCADPCEKPNKGARAWTEPSGKRNITLCFDQIKSFSVPATAWIIVHENVHRALNVWPNPHPWDAPNFTACIGAGASSTGFGAVVLDNPDSYACFASRIWYPL